MKYEFLEVDASYLLILNSNVCKRFSKKMFSKQEAEEAASKEVGKAIKKYGAAKVRYDGFVTC